MPARKLVTDVLSVKGDRLICMGDTYRNSFTEMRAAIWATMMRVTQVEFLEQALEDGVNKASVTYGGMWHSRHTDAKSN